MATLLHWYESGINPTGKLLQLSTFLGHSKIKATTVSDDHVGAASGVAPSLTIATRTQELPIDMDLYLPESWADDRARCRVAHIPDDVVYRAKWRIALDLIERNVQAGIPLGLMLGDSAFGDVGAFRDGVRALGFDYALDVKCHTRVEILGEDGSVSDPMSVEMAAEVIGSRKPAKTPLGQPGQ